MTDEFRLPPDAKFCFTGRTDEETSLVCPTELVPEHTLAREDGWKAFRIWGVLDFSLTGILPQSALHLQAARRLSLHNHRQHDQILCTGVGNAVLGALQTDMADARLQP